MRRRVAPVPRRVATLPCRRRSDAACCVWRAHSPDHRAASPGGGAALRRVAASPPCRAPSPRGARTSPCGARPSRRRAAATPPCTRAAAVRLDALSLFQRAERSGRPAASSVPGTWRVGLRESRCGGAARRRRRVRSCVGQRAVPLRRGASLFGPIAVWLRATTASFDASAASPCRACNVTWRACSVARHACSVVWRACSVAWLACSVTRRACRMGWRTRTLPGPPGIVSSPPRVACRSQRSGSWPPDVAPSLAGITSWLGCTVASEGGAQERGPFDAPTCSSRGFSITHPST